MKLVESSFPHRVSSSGARVGRVPLAPSKPGRSQDGRLGSRGWSTKALSAIVIPMHMENARKYKSEIERRIIRRAHAEPEYRVRLLNNPKTALEEELGVNLPESLQVRVVEERSDLLFIVLPVDVLGIPAEAVEVMVGSEREDSLDMPSV